VSWLVYVLVSADGQRTYVGVTIDLEKRLRQHNGALPGGARATRAGRPWTVGATFGPLADRGEAQALEYRIRQRVGLDRLRGDPK
jgi:structure-specific endonuclease subunit SLX1